ncbi:MAG: CHRD domain-containing protein [Phycisphaerales bacterium]|nr:CHRD domain-containing protein [Phycisphaerales bacterium]
MKTANAFAAAGAILVLTTVASADILHFRALLNGANEAPNPGDPDGSGIADVFIDTGTPIPTVSWDIVVANILLPISADHIHQAPAGVAGPVVVDFSAQLSGSGVSDPDLTNVVANPAGFYVNVHNSQFPGGAVRGQLFLVPAPGAAALMALAAGLGLRRRR